MFADLDAHAADAGRIIVLIWDEFTYFISELALGGHARDAMPCSIRFVPRDKTISMFA